jgi:hypothetical protein
MLGAEQQVQGWGQSESRSAASAIIIHVSNTRRPRKWEENMVARFPAGTFKRITFVLEPDEVRTDFVYAAIERELRRRESKQ